MKKRPPETARKPAQPATSEQYDGRGAAARDCTGAASHQTVVRASVGTSAARDERAKAAAETPPPETAREPAQPATSELSNGRGAAARDCTGAASHHTVVRASVEASATRDERAGRRHDSRGAAA
eukprot:scaffold18477_cov71-Phaeocystis_antarctica.AAC.1